MTGAASRAVPCAASRSRTISDASTEMVEQSTTICGAVPAEIRPDGPSTASSRSWGVPTVANTISRSASSAAELTIFAPYASSGSALALVLL